MKCGRCLAVNRDGRRFCASCGNALPHACPSCGYGNEPTERFCGACGRTLSAAESSRAIPTSRSYTPRHLADHILTLRGALEGERKQVTVLFCDVVESSQLAERLGPEGMHEVMDRALRLMAEGVHRYEGT